MPVVAEEETLVTVNCTVAYMGQCMSWNKCKASCTSMGSSSYRWSSAADIYISQTQQKIVAFSQKNILRWFHDGCCECVGSSCQARPENQFGIDQSR